ncbi:G-type lectin S-receptor-like serine/threonine-protein kinase At4g27290 [Ipomoea triloba]|uniref:G-type lectin S-receptor-like serine/threonine-protein kinase At4g27290 n=1 Tax=Ipomoea triloba TaxID=35885 RepID=UPI00125E0C6B|nr:G-type lectin S-receptor-like serine/threonine-protein kinase At4g27290 [Ipomoea triloba]
MGRVVFLTLFLCFLCNLGTSTDILRPGDVITPNTTLVSPNGNFALGFFRPGNSSSLFLGIWYNNLKDSVIWVANRESPLHDQDSHPRFTIGDDGNLRLLDGVRNPKWSTNVSGPPGNYAAEAQLKDTGNFILKQGNSTVWESFDDGGDTLMPEMRLKVNMRTGERNILRSWTSIDDPRPGKFSFGMDPNGAPQIFIWKQNNNNTNTNNNNIPYYRTNMFEYGYSLSWYIPRQGYSVYLSFAARDDEFYFSYTYRDASVPLRFFLSHDGYIKVLSKPENSEKWQNRLQFPDPTKCEMYGSCGSFGSCKKTGSNSVCSCLEGFKPKSGKDWENGNYSGGCVRRIGLECNENDKFMRFEWMKLPDHPVSLGNNSNMTFSECEAQCYSNCSCSAFAYNNMSDIAKCLNWFGDLVDLAHNNSAALRDLHVRVHASELNGIGGIGNSAHKSISPLQVAIMVSLVSAVSLVVISVLGYILKRRYYRKKGEKSIATASQKSNALSPLGNGDVELLQLSLERILDATDNFNEANKLGEGGFGPVFKGFLYEFGMVAIKRLCKQSSQGLEEFMNELKLIAKLQHKNLVSLLGCCIEDDEKILIYEYMPNRSLDKLLFGEKDNLDWNTRFQIIEGVAQGILYLHKYSRLKVIHRDLKASNILLDETMKPKISDFGLARIFGLDQTQAETNRVVGTYGYISPEYVLHGQFSEKSDVYSFGVLLLEIINGKKNSDFIHSQLSVSLIGWAWKNWKEGRPHEFVDLAIMRSSCDALKVIRCIEVGLLCVQAIPTDRPTMFDVVLMLSNPTLSIPPLKEPAFVTTNHSNAIVSMCYTKASDYYSKNEVTISDIIEPR